MLRSRDPPDSPVLLLAPEEFCAQVLIRARLWLQGGRSVDRLEHGRPQYLGVLGEIQPAELIETQPVGHVLKGTECGEQPIHHADEEVIPRDVRLRAAALYRVRSARLFSAVSISAGVLITAVPIRV